MTVASKSACAYCGTAMAAGDEICPSCGAPNPGYRSGGEPGTRRPRTIEELQAFCASKGMPLEKMRFFIGVNEPSPRAFGIYREGDRFIVYKNKADGSRAVRYDGPDEAYAVKELYLKLAEEHRLRSGISAGERSRAPSGASRSARPQKRSGWISIVIGAVIVLVLLLWLKSGRAGHGKDGYYRVGERLFYRYGSSWFVDSDFSDWRSVDSFPVEDYGDYFVGAGYNEDWGGSDFAGSEAWETLQDSEDDGWDWDNDDWDDDDWDWDDDYDDWDSGDTDWDSDW
jgi:hypothetical protein